MKTLAGVLIVSATLAVQACASSNAPDPAQGSALSEPTAVGEATVVTVRGWIDTIDKTNRTVTLKGPRGGTVTLDVKDPKKLDAVAVGDPVVAAYVEALAVEVEKAGTATPG